MADPLVYENVAELVWSQDSAAQKDLESFSEVEMDMPVWIGRLSGKETRQWGRLLKLYELKTIESFARLG